MVAKDLKLDKNLDIKLKELPKYYDFFLPLAGAEAYHASNDNEGDRNAAYKMGELYDFLIQENPDVYKTETSVHNLNMFCPSCCFAFLRKTREYLKAIFSPTLWYNTLQAMARTHISI